MAYRTTSEAWEERVSSIAAAAHDPEALPPLIVEWRGDELGLCDGNHRHEALRRRGEQHVWAFVWCNSEAEFLNARDQFAATR
jgi:hypothetical protein